MVFRIGTILGPTVKNQITGLWDGRRILAVRGSESPFVFVWVDDVAAAMTRAATDGPAGIFNVAGDGRMTVREIAARLGKPLLTVPAGVLRSVFESAGCCASPSMDRSRSGSCGIAPSSRTTR